MTSVHITAAEAARLLQYTAETGELKWLCQPGRRVKAGDVAGYDDGSGYRAVRVLGRIHRAHRLAWLLHYGEWPTGMIDHINGDKSDNRIANLHVVTNSANMENQRRARSDNQSGLLGVRRSRHEGRWLARIKANGVSMALGYFSSREAAHAAYIEAKRKLHLNGRL